MDFLSLQPVRFVLVYCFARLASRASVLNILHLSCQLFAVGMHPSSSLVLCAYVLSTMLASPVCSAIPFLLCILIERFNWSCSLFLRCFPFGKVCHLLKPLFRVWLAHTTKPSSTSKTPHECIRASQRPSWWYKTTLAPVAS